MIARLRELALTRKERQKKNNATAFRDAIAEAVRLLGPRSFGDVIYLISDGEDNRSKTDWKVLRSALSSAGIRLFAIALGDSYGKPDQFYVESTVPGLFDTVIGSAGIFLLIPEPSAKTMVNGFAPRYYYEQARKDAAKMLPAFYSHVTSFYKLQIQLPQPTKQLGTWKLEVIEGGSIIKRSTNLSYQRQLVACQAP